MNDTRKGHTAWELCALCLALLSIALCLTILDVPQLVSGAPDPDLVITEFMAYNRSILADSDGDYSDWIEIHNRGAVDVDIGEWYLTDNRNDLAKWQFPDVALAAGDHLVVFASGKGTTHHSELHADFRLNRQGEYIALVKSDGKTVASEYTISDLPQYVDVSYGLDAAQNERYFAIPTPGMSNNAAVAELGPALSNADHNPMLPHTDEPITVTVEAKESLAPIDTVTLHYSVMYEDAVGVSMFDDGAHGDGIMGDGLYGAEIPNHAYQPGEMVRYYFTATDVEGRVSRWPLFPDPSNSPEYLGTMVTDPSTVSLLPVLYWFVEDPTAAERQTGARASLFYDGTFYDNVFVRQRGISSSSWPKKSLKFDFAPGHYFQFSPLEAPVEEINLNTTSSDKAYIRQVLAWETYRDAGAPYCISFPVRVQQNGAFYSVAIFVEQPDERYLERQGLDPEGAMYKMHHNTLNSSTRNTAKQTRRYEDNSDLQALMDGLSLSGKARRNFLFDNVNIPAVINYQAVATILHDRDQGHNNYYAYRDTNGTGEWTLLPWDKDLTFGLNYNEGLDLTVVADDDPQSHPLSCYKYNRLVSAIYEFPVTREMFLRRLRTLMDELLQPPGTPANERYYERRINELFVQMQPDVALDIVAWEALREPQTFAGAIYSLRNDYLAVRRVHLYGTHGLDNGGVIPDEQPITTTVQFDRIGFAAPSQKPDTEYFTLVNANPYAADISGWRVEGAVEYVFQPGVVIPAGGVLYVSPNVVAFRARTTSPTRKEGHFVQGNYEGTLSNTGGTLRLYDSVGVLIARRSFWDPNSLTRWSVVSVFPLLILSIILYRRLEKPVANRNPRNSEEP